jgi:hypothetical protein
MFYLFAAADRVRYLIIKRYRGRDPLLHVFKIINLGLRA